MVRNLLFVFAFFLCRSGAFANLQSSTIKGVLKDDADMPIARLELYLSNGKTTRTHENGSFEFVNVLQGVYELKAEWGGQLVVLKSFEVKSNDQLIDLGSINVERNIQLKEVSITDAFINRHIERMPDVKDHVIYATKKNEVVRLTTATANLAQNNSRQLFAKVPGVHVWESDGSGVQMGIATRGLSPNRMWEFNTRQNGYDISSDPFGYPEAYYTPSVESLDRIEVIRGAASLQFGAQYGGVVNYIKKKSISGKKLGVESMQTVGSYGMFSTFNAIGGNYKKFSYYANINYRRSDGWRANNDYTTWNGFINIGYQVTKKLSINIEFTRMDQVVHQPGGLTDSLFKQNAQQSIRNRNWFEVKWNIPAVVLDYKLSQRQSLNVKVFGLSGERNSIGFMSALNFPDTINRTSAQYANRQIDIDKYANWGTEVRHIIQFNVAKQQHTLSSGIRFFNGNTDRIRNNNGDRGLGYTLAAESPVLSRAFTYTSQNAAVFSELLIQVNDRLSIVPGIRAEYLFNTAQGNIGTVQTNQKSTRTFFLAGLGAQYKLKGSTNFYANFAQAYRPVLFSDLTLDRPTDSIDANLSDSRGYNIDLGYRGNIANIIAFDVSVFYMMYGNRIGMYALPNGVNYRSNIGSSVSKGLESFIEFTPTSFIANNKLGNISFFNSTALINAQYVQWNNPDQRQNLTNKWVENAPQQIIRSGITYSLKSFSTSLQHSYVSQAYSDALNIRIPSANGQNGLIPAYQVWDISAQLVIKNRYRINAGINNLTNAMYFTRRAGGYPGPGLLPADGRLWYVGVGVKL